MSPHDDFNLFIKFIWNILYKVENSQDFHMFNVMEIIEKKLKEFYVKEIISIPNRKNQ